MNILFDVKELYYVPQYLPVLKQLQQQNFNCHFVFHSKNDELINDAMKKVVNDEQLSATFVKDWPEALAFYQQQKAHWIIFGNSVDNIELLHKVSKTVLMQHGIGPKACYYNVSNNQTTVRFVEGAHRLNRLNKLYPQGNFVDTGYAKLDPLFNGTPSNLTLKDLGLDPAKKTLLYAPTFYPSSIGRFSKNFAEQFSQYNIIVKPHFFSLTSSKYKDQQALFKRWQKSDNVYVAGVDEYNLLSFMSVSDVLISDASSAMFEFAALDKPVIWCDFYKLRLFYRGIFSFRVKKRLDPDIEFFHQIAERAQDYKALKSAVDSAIASPKAKSNARKSLTLELAGLTDGQSSKRICQYLIDHK